MGIVFSFFVLFFPFFLEGQQADNRHLVGYERHKYPMGFKRSSVMAHSLCSNCHRVESKMEFDWSLKRERVCRSCHVVRPYNEGPMRNDIVIPVYRRIYWQYYVIPKARELYRHNIHKQTFEPDVRMLLDMRRQEIQERRRRNQR